MNTAPDPQLAPAGAPGGGELRLPRHPGEVRRFWAAHPRLTDTLLALVWGLLAAAGAVRARNDTPNPTWLTALTILLVAVSVAGVYVRREEPLLTVALSAAAILASVWAPGDIVLAPAVFAVYSVAVYRSIRAGWICGAAVWAASTVATAVGQLVPRTRGSANPFNPAQGTDVSALSSVLAFAVQFGVILALAVALGVNVGSRRRYLQALIDRAHQLAVERDQQAQLATAAERARIAREMHDIVSHSLTMMIALAEGSAVAAERAAPDAAAAMRKAADTGRAAMIDMRRMLGVLGDDEPQTAPQPGLADLPELIAQFRSLGIPAAYRQDGPEPQDPTIQLAIYRLVQEALTNTLRYAHGPTKVQVHVVVREGALTAAVTDNGTAGFPASPAGTGRGLLGLRERVASLGGTLTAGPLSGGQGWKVEAMIPLDDVSKDGRP